MSTNKNTRIKINASVEIDKALSDTFLIGEVKDSEILKAIPNLLKDEGVSFSRVFFYGGLYVLIGFDDASEASGLLKNTSCWNKWFQWIKPGDYTKEVNFQRAADVEIVGLPVQYRSVENITKILSNVGRVLTVDEELWKIDLSFCAGCIITESTTMINKEVTGEDDDEKIFTIGIIEKGFRLKPFDDNGNWGSNALQGSTDEDALNNLDDIEIEDDDDSDGISESWNNNDWEEGEFRPNDLKVRTEDNTPINDVTYPTVETSVEAINSNSSSAHAENNTVIEESIIEVSDVVPTSIKSAPVIQIPWDSPKIDGSMFGTFCASAPSGLSNNMGRSNGSKKRRRCSPPGRTGQIIGTSDKSRFHQMTPTSSIDLNKKIISCEATCSSGHASQSQSHSSIPEILKTVEVGTDVGFVISENDQVLCNILAGEGAQNGN